VKNNVNMKKLRDIDKRRMSLRACEAAFRKESMTTWLERRKDVYAIGCKKT
jgi:hypothetical protein